MISSTPEQFPRGIDVTYVPKSWGCGLIDLTYVPTYLENRKLQRYQLFSLKKAFFPNNDHRKDSTITGLAKMNRSINPHPWLFGIYVTSILRGNCSGVELIIEFVHFVKLSFFPNFNFSIWSEFQKRVPIPKFRFGFFCLYSWVTRYILVCLLLVL